MRELYSSTRSMVALGLVIGAVTASEVQAMPLMEQPQTRTYEPAKLSPETAVSRAVLAAALETKKPISPEMKVARSLEQRIALGLPVNYVGGDDLYWSSIKGNILQYRTEVPLVAKVGNKTGYFRIAAPTEGLVFRDRIRVVPINAAKTVFGKSERSAYYNCDFKPSDRGVIKVSSDGTPYTDIMYANGTSVRHQVGATYLYNRPHTPPEILRPPETCK